MENLSGDVLEGEQVDITQPNENNIEFDNLVRSYLFYFYYRYFFYIWP